MKQIALSEIKDDFSRFLRKAASEQIVITRHGRPAGILVGFASEDDWLDYRLEHDPIFHLLEEIDFDYADARCLRLASHLGGVLAGRDRADKGRFLRV